MNRYKKVLVIVVLIAIFTIQPAFAYLEPEHNDFMSKVLFGENHRVKNDAIKLLEYASYLAIDQNNNYGYEKLKFLNDKGVKRIPNSIRTINYSSNSEHRIHTHRGWEYTGYSGYKDNNDVAHWKIRKEILLETVSLVFNFKRFAEPRLGIDFGFDKRCNSFAALIYYIHVLSDHIYDYKQRKGQINQNNELNKEPIMLLVRSHPGETNPDIIYELEKHLKILFDKPSNRNLYGELTRRLKEVRLDAEKTIDPKFERGTHEHAEKVMKILIDYVPGLLKKEDFFKAVFIQNSY